MPIPRWLLSIVLLIASNLFMTIAWYNHLNKKAWSMVTAILISWLVAFVEYCLQVPANRLGSDRFDGPFTTAQLKTMQEAITLVVFVGFSFLVLHERPKWTDYAGFALIFLGVAISMLGPSFFTTGQTGPAIQH